MADGTAIEWTHLDGYRGVTWNAVTGCDRVSPGCDNCYALTLAKRLKAMGNPRYQNDGRAPSSGPGFAVTLHPDKVEEPLRWKKPHVVFVNSMSDLFHASVPRAFVDRMLRTMEATPQHIYQVLTKRPARMAMLLRELQPRPLPNVWFGTSVETQEYADKRIPLLLEAPAAIRFLSCEPLLGPLDLTPWISSLDWIITGGESGPRFRPVDVEWVRAIRDQSVNAQVAFFHKQNGGRTPKARGRDLDGRTWDEFPVRTTALSRPA